MSIHKEGTALGHAIEILKSGIPSKYDKALNRLGPEIQTRWAEVTKSRRMELIAFDTVEPSYAADADGLLQFLESEAHGLESRRTELENPELIRDQSLGEALRPDLMDALVRYEVHLDRKLERMLSVLVRLKELRTTPAH